MWLRNLLSRIAALLRSPAERERERQEADRKHILAIAARHPLPSAWTDVADVWPLVLHGLDHQGHPRDRLNAILAALEKRSSRGWDEFGLDFETPDSKMVEVMFIGDCRQCEAERLLSALHDLQQAIEDHNSGK